MKYHCTFSVLLTCSLFTASPGYGSEGDTQEAVERNVPAFMPFTGKVGRDKVRLRLQPSLESHVVREVTKGEPLAIVGEDEDFFAVKPPKGMKLYVFRTYILDNVIEANRVNVRLEPNTEAPIVVQLNAGDVICGDIAPENNKWYSIVPPESAVLYVSKDYVEKVGGPSMYAEILEKKEEINLLFAKAEAAKQAKDPSNHTSPKHLGKLEDGIAALKEIIHNYAHDFPECVKKAKQALLSLEEDAVDAKLAHFEEKRHGINEHTAHAPMSPTSEPILVHEGTVTSNAKPFMTAQEEGLPHFAMDAHHSSLWRDRELQFYQTWKGSNPEASIDDFYKNEFEQAVVLRGIVEPYHHLVKNKPGDFILVNVASRSPMAYLYSNHLSLENLVGREVTIKVAERPNNHFAFPAFYVLAVE